MIRFGRLTAKDFCCFGSLDVDIGGAGLVHVTGRNGDGKSTLMRAICWALYGKSLEGDDGDAVIRSGAKEAVLVISFFDHHRSEWRVTRRRRKGSTVLDVESRTAEGELSPIAASKDVLQAHVTSAVGMDFEAFRNSVVYSYGDVGRFANPGAKDSERKAILHRMLGTEIFRECHEHVKSRALAARGELAVAEKMVEVSSAKLRNAEEALFDARNDYAKWESERAARRADMLARARAFTASARSRDDVDTRALDAARAASKAASDAADVATAAWNECVNAFNDVKVNHAVARNAMLVARERHALLEGDKCPTCGSDLCEGDGLKAFEKSVAAVESACAAETAALADETKAAAAFVEADRKKKLALAELREAQERFSEIAASASAVTSKKEFAAESARSILKTIKEEDELGNPHKSSVERHEIGASSAAKELSAATAKVKSLERDGAYFGFWVRGFSNQGLPSYVLDDALAYLTEKANHYLASLSEPDRRIFVEFSAQRELTSKKGEVRDEIAVKTSVGELSGYVLSRGQQKRLDLASGFALMDLAALKGGAVGLLLLDEVLDGLDESGRAAAVSLLADMRASRPSIFVISHEQDVGEVFERRWTISRVDGLSVLTTEDA